MNPVQGEHLDDILPIVVTGWEFSSSMGRGINGDMAKLLTLLETCRQRRSILRVKETTEILIKSLTEA